MCSILKPSRKKLGENLQQWVVPNGGGGMKSAFVAELFYVGFKQYIILYWILIVVFLPGM